MPNMKDILLFVVLAVFCGCVSFNKENTNDALPDTAFCAANSKTAFNDSIFGCWGNHPETGNSILCITSRDSLFWVDPSLWCTYRINNDTITMTVDTFVYFQGRVEFRNDSLLLKSDDFTWEYGRFK